MKILINFLFLSYFIIPFLYAKNEVINLWDSTECKNDILLHCDSERNRTNSMLINCLEQSDAMINLLSKKCQHFLWNFKVKYLNIIYFNLVTNNDCTLELAKFRNCEREDEPVICLIKSKEQVTNHLCLSHLNEVATILFSDIFVVYKFITSCSDSIRELQCGRLEDKTRPFSTDRFISRITSQGMTIECLINSLNKVNGACRKQILRLGELQSDDFHLNPNLYFSCRHERESLCGSIESGKSRIYRCLETQKTNSAMSLKCQNALKLKHKLETYDYKIRHHFSEICAKDISKHNCSMSVNQTNSTELLSIMICLLQAEHKDSLNKDCRAEVLAVRIQMAQNIEMFPEIKINCKHEIIKYCSQINKETDSVVHCLMRYSMPAMENKFNVHCEKSLKNFIKIVDPTENIEELDPVISQVCSNELSNQCNSQNYIEPNDRYQCLLELIDEDKIQVNLENECKTHLTTLARFIDQEYSLNHKLFRVCHEDAVRHCGATDNIVFDDKSSIVPQAIIHCLIRKWNRQHINKEKSLISYKCVLEVKNVMKIEASNLMLNFKIYVTCSMDVVKHCKSMPHTMDCLQINYPNLANPCKSVISDFLSLDGEEYSLKKLIARSCSPMVRSFCHVETNDGKKDYMECLVRNKFDKNMDNNCRIAIEHYQIIGLDNYQIDHKFARFCSEEIKKFCISLLPNFHENVEDSDEIENSVTKRPPVSKSEIVSCLSKTLTLQLINKNNTFSSQCYEQFTFEFLQQTNSINFDPEMRLMCEVDINEHCSQNFAQDSVLTCLNRYQDVLKEKCRLLLISRQQLSALDTGFDAAIQRYCKEMIKIYCGKENSHKVFRCLHEHMRREGFDSECKEKVQNRLKRRLVDIRLNPELLDDCKDEIKAHCNVIKDVDIRISQMNYIDKYQIIDCLRNVYVEHRKFLGGRCRRLVFHIVLDAHSDVHLDPGLYDACNTEITTLCHESLIANASNTNGKVQDCLKHSLLLGIIPNEKCSKEVTRLLREGLADIHVDPQLYTTCRSEISTICKRELLGHGRKLSCLLWALDDKGMTSQISKECKMVLHGRREMWEFASRMEPPKHPYEVFQLLSMSESKYYFLVTFMAIVACILVFGILFGRYTKTINKIHRKRRS